MANVDKFKLTLPNHGSPDDQIYESDGDVTVRTEQSRQFLVAAEGTVVGFAQNLWDDVGNSNTMKTPMASGHLGAAGGSHIFSFEFTDWTGNSNAWGPNSSYTDALERAIVFDMETSRASPDSLNPATLETGPISSTTSEYDAMPVIVSELETDRPGDDPNKTTIRVTCVETIDLSQAIDGASGVSAEYEIADPSGTESAIPIAADTLGGGRADSSGTGILQQGAEIAQSALSEKNAASSATSSPTTDQTKILPGGIDLRGAFRGSNARDLANQLRTNYLANEDVPEVNLNAPGISSSTTPLTGTYTIGENSHIDPLIPQVEGGVWGYRLDLQEA